MKNWQLKVGIVAFSLVLYASVVSAKANELGWTLTQVSHNTPIGGNQSIIITPSGLRTTDNKNGISMFTKGPNWNVVIFNSQTKKYFQTPLRDWLLSIKKRNLSRKFEGAKWHRGAQGAICKTPAYEFIMDRSTAPQLNSFAGARSGRPTVVYSSASLWVASDIVTPNQVSNIISTLYGVPDCQRVPLRLVVTERGRAPNYIVDTTRVSRINVPDALFALPLGFKPVKTDMEVLMDNDSMDSFNDMLNDLDTPAKPRKPVPRRTR